MSRLLTIAITFHWLAVFSLLTMLSIFPGKDGPTGISLFGVMLVPVPEGKIRIIVVGFTLLFALCAALFLWALTTVICAHRDAELDTADVIEKAFASASVAMTIVLAYGVARAESGLIPVMAMNYAALIASFVALRVDRPLTAASRERSLVGALRAKAMDASHSSLLARLIPASIETRGEQR